MGNLSNMDEILALFQLEDASSLNIMAAPEFQSWHTPPNSPEVNCLVLGFEPQKPLRPFLDALSAVYPRDHLVYIAITENSEKTGVESVPLNRLMDLPMDKVIRAVLIPALPPGSSFERFQEIVAHLRTPDGCPWDREQTHLTLRKHLIEEAYETLDAMDSGSAEKMREEFGDLLLQIVLHSQIAFESHEFTMTEVIRGIHDKIVRRHPHVFGDVEVSGVGNVLQNWEKIKADEREANGHGEKSLLDGLPSMLPSLVQAQEMQERAARVGFDWPEIDGVLEKINEEIAEIRNAENVNELTAEIGDLFFALVNLARWKGVDAESALRDANRKFKTRFSFIEDNARTTGRRLSDLTLDEMERLWQSSKNRE
jgi:tetrapyrrole methylase family protein/MazG family protein